MKQQTIIDNLTKEFQQNKSNIAFFVTGSVAREETTQYSDLDLILIAKEKSDYEEKIIDGITIEMKTNTIEGYISKMNENPRNIYRWLDAKTIFGDEKILIKLQEHAQRIMISAIPTEFPRKWLESAKIKIIAARENKDDLNLGFQVSNILWKIVEGFYILNKLPLPPSTTAFRRISALKILPDNFSELWKKTLAGNLEERSEATLGLLNFLLK